MKTVKLTNNKYALIDDEDYLLISQHKWHAAFIGSTGKYRAASRIKGKLVYMHRLIMDEPKGLCVDHKNHESLDNRRENLRICTKKQNCQNSIKRRSTSSKYKGVTWRKRLNKWVARIKVDGVYKHLGVFDKEIDAALEYDNNAKKYFKDFASVNLV